jgi:MFS family permease
MLALTMREPLRGSAEARGPLTLQPQAASRRAVIGLLRIRTLVAAVLANTFVVCAQTGVGGFVALYTTRQFGVDLAQVGAMVGGPLLIGSLVGNSLGGWLVDWRSRHSRRAHLEIAVVASALCAGGMVATFAAGSPAAFAGAFLVATLAGNLGLPGLLAIIQNLVIPPLRGSAAAIQQLSSNLLGRTLGLTLVGLLADQAHDLRLALLVLAPAALVLAAISAAVGLMSMPQDVAAMDEQWEQLSQASSACC